MEGIFKLVKTFEFDVVLPEESFKARVELFQNIERRTHYRINLWQTELFRLMPTFPQDVNGTPLHNTDDLISVARSLTPVNMNYEKFTANNLDEAIDITINKIKSIVDYFSANKV